MSNKLCKALPEELKAEIKSKAHRSADAEEKRLKQKNYTYDRMVTRVNGYLCGHIAGATEYAHYKVKLGTAIKLLQTVKGFHESGLLPDRFIYNEIKSFLDGSK